MEWRVNELAELLCEYTKDKATTKARTPGTKATGNGVRDALETLDLVQTSTYRTAACMIGYIVCDSPDCQLAAKDVMGMTGEPRNLH